MGGKMVVSFCITPLKDLVIAFLVEKPYFWIYSVLMFLAIATFSIDRRLGTLTYFVHN